MKQPRDAGHRLGGQEEREMSRSLMSMEVRSQKGWEGELIKKEGGKSNRT